MEFGQDMISQWARLSHILAFEEWKMRSKSKSAKKLSKATRKRLGEWRKFRFSKFTTHFHLFGCKYLYQPNVSIGKSYLLKISYELDL